MKAVVPGFIRFFLLGALFFAVAALQQTPLVAAFGIKPNLVLAFLVALAFVVRRGAAYAVFLLFAVAVLLRQGTPVLAVLALCLIALATFFCKRIVPWQTRLAAVVCASSATVFFYLITGASFVLAHPGVVGAELVYTGVMSWLGLLLFERILRKT